jgi:hypothetical protein
MPSAPFNVRWCSDNVLLTFIFYWRIDSELSDILIFGEQCWCRSQDSFSDSFAFCQHYFYCVSRSSSPVTVFPARRGMIYGNYIANIQEELYNAQHKDWDRSQLIIYKLIPFSEARVWKIMKQYIRTYWKSICTFFNFCLCYVLGISLIFYCTTWKGCNDGALRFLLLFLWASDTVQCVKNAVTTFRQLEYLPLFTPELKGNKIKHLGTLVISWKTVNCESRVINVRYNVIILLLVWIIASHCALFIKIDIVVSVWVNYGYGEFIEISVVIGVFLAAVSISEAVWIH